MSEAQFDVLVSKYVALRDKIRGIEEKHKEELAPYKETLEQLNGFLLARLDATGQDSASTSAGTVYKTTKYSAAIADMKAFWDFVVATKDFDLVDRRANKTAVKAYMEKNHAPVPGVNFSSMAEVGVRRKTNGNGKH